VKRVPCSFVPGVAPVVVAALLFSAACGTETQDEEAAYGETESELTASTTVGDWSKFPDGYQCLVAVQLFYPAKFDVRLPTARNSWTGSCAPNGACHLWLDDRPSSTAWERIPNDGNHLPTTYDLIVYPPTASNAYGHIASVDHVEGKTIFVMDDNYVGHLRKASKPHTVSTAPYGWYHLKKLGDPTPTTGACVEGGYYCGGDKVSGSPSSLYRCNRDGSATRVFACSHGCAVHSGRDDTCRCVANSTYCGGDMVVGDSDDLYRCTSDGTGFTFVKQCASGCSVNSGNDDTCR
jgi:hypothetical protein